MVGHRALTEASGSIENDDEWLKDFFGSEDFRNAGDYRNAGDVRYTDDELANA